MGNMRSRAAAADWRCSALNHTAQQQQQLKQLLDPSRLGIVS
jgi:hypothetical protein